MSAGRMTQHSLTMGALAAGALLSAPILFPQAAFAAPKDTICMAGTSKGMPETRNFTVITTQERAEEMERRGFVRTPCDGKDNNLAQYREEICEAAKNTPVGVQQRLDVHYGIAPNELCQLAEELSPK